LVNLDQYIKRHVPIGSYRSSYLSFKHTVFWVYDFFARYKTWKATLSFVMCAQNNSAPTGWFFMKLDMTKFLGNPSRIFKLHYNTSRKRVPNELFSEREFFLTKFVEKIQTYILRSVIFLTQSHRLWFNVEKYGTDRLQIKTQRCAENMRLSRWKQVLRIYNTYCFSTATMVARTRLSVTIYVHCLPCYWLVTLIVPKQSAMEWEYRC
jgi:hypothetical protein